MSPVEPLRGLYAITPLALCAEPERLLAAVEAVLRGGARMIQYRDKSGDHERRARSAAELRILCERHGALLIVNDDVELAAAAGAHGVHLGEDDLPLPQARARLGADAIIGITCADDPLRVRAADEGGASYVALGAFHPTPTKPGAKKATPELLRQVRAATRLPICAIGGITPANGGPLVGMGADLLAAVEGVFGAADPGDAARAYVRLFGDAR